MGYVKNLPQALGGVDLTFKKLQEMPSEVFRDYVWQVFLRVLRETPQWSGKAAANWNLSIGSPNFNFDDTLGDAVDLHGVAHARGDERWLRVARARNKPIVARIKARDKVFISNGVVGDNGGKGALAYMQALQSSSYWMQHLRQVNRPYEIAQESVVIVTEQFGRRGFFAPRVGGESWKAE
jgi:hypothetical protein